MTANTCDEGSRVRYLLSLYFNDDSCCSKSYFNTLNRIEVIHRVSRPKRIEQGWIIFVFKVMTKNNSSKWKNRNSELVIKSHWFPLRLCIPSNIRLSSSNNKATVVLSDIQILKRPICWIIHLNHFILIRHHGMINYFSSASNSIRLVQSHQWFTSKLILEKETNKTTCFRVLILLHWATHKHLAKHIESSHFHWIEESIIYPSLAMPLIRLK